MKVPQPSTRRLRCACGERKAQAWFAVLSTYLFIRCPVCRRELRSESIQDIMKRKDGKALALVTLKLHADWETLGGSIPSS